MDFTKVFEDYADQLIKEKGVPLDADGREFFLNELMENINRKIMEQLPEEVIDQLADALAANDTEGAIKILDQHIGDFGALVREAAL